MDQLNLFAIHEVLTLCDAADDLERASGELDEVLGNDEYSNDLIIPAFSATLRLAAQLGDNGLLTGEEYADCLQMKQLYVDALSQLNTLANKLVRRIPKGVGVEDAYGLSYLIKRLQVK